MIVHCAFETVGKCPESPEEPNVEGLSDRAGFRSVDAMNAEQNSAFSSLLRVWNQREDARSARNIRALSDASARLAQQREVTRVTLGVR